MNKRTCLIGFDEPELEELKSRISGPIVSHSTMPNYNVVAGELFVDKESGGWQVPVDRVVFHGIFENDYDLFIALCLWGGNCFPNPLGMLNCRKKHACLVRALSQTEFPGKNLGFVLAGNSVSVEDEQVAKWGDWHCGENKERLIGEWEAPFASTLEPFIQGQAVRVVLLGDEILQIHLEGVDWLKSIHDDTAGFMSVDPELESDTRNLAKYFDLEVIANDYMIAENGSKYLLEVNHIPNVTRFPEIWKRYSQLVINWCENIV
ncbi:MAG: hypothetical protein COA78_05645 [Blastopirellula sp.]|nr:MAG: hypothetical protein COA78_05645 [Blastopirellula sp.]